MFCLGSLFMKQNAYVAEGGNEGGRGATSTSISIFDSYDIKTLLCWHFEASEYIINKLKSQGVYIINIKY